MYIQNKKRVLAKFYMYSNTMQQISQEFCREKKISDEFKFIYYRIGVKIAGSKQQKFYR